MAVVSGKDGTVSVGGAIADCTGWNLTMTSNNPAYASSSTSGYKNRVAGVKDASGSYSAKHNGSVPTVGTATASASFTLDGTSSFSLNIIIDSVNIEVDMDDGDVVGYSVDFSGNGLVTEA